MFVPFTVDSRAQVSADFAFRGRYDAWITLLDVSREQVSQTLPPRITPMPHASLPAALQTAPDRHPILILAGRHYDVKPVTFGRGLSGDSFADFQYVSIFDQADGQGMSPEAFAMRGKFLFPLDYSEVMVVVPYVRFTNKAPFSKEVTEPLNCPAKIYLDDVAGTLIGKAGALPKEYIAHIDMDQSSFVAGKENLELFNLLEARRHPLNPLWAHHGCIQTIFTYPIVSKFRGIPLYSMITGQWGIPSPYPSGLNYSLANEFSPPAAGSFAPSPCDDNAPFGSFWMQDCRWLLNAPEIVLA